MDRIRNLETDERWCPAQKIAGVERGSKGDPDIDPAFPAWLPF